MTTNNAPSNITATRVPESERLAFLPRHFGRLMMKVEREIFAQMAELCDAYSGDLWHFVDLSNGGAFLAPAGSDPLVIAVHSNDYRGTMSAEAAGITATLFALSHLAFRHPHEERLSERFHRLHVRAGDPGVKGAGNWAELPDGLMIGRGIYQGAYFCDPCGMALLAGSVALDTVARPVSRALTQLGA